VSISFNALDANLKGSEATLAETLIEAGVFTQEVAESVGLSVTVEPTPEDETSDFLSHFDLDEVQGILGEEYWQQYWIMPEEHYFTFDDGRVVRWQFLHLDGFDISEFGQTEVGNIFGSITRHVFLVLGSDGATYIYIDIGNTIELYREWGVADDDMPDWLTEQHRSYHVIPLS